MVTYPRLLRFCHLLLFGGLLLTQYGCAPLNYEMRWGVEQMENSQIPVWPSVSDTPRYRYAGVLQGEQNFVLQEGQTRNFFEKVLDFVTGIGTPDNSDMQMVRPNGGAVDNQGRVLVSDAGRAAIFVFDPAKGTLQKWTQATERVEFKTPVGIVALANGETWVSDADLGMVVRLNAAGEPLGVIGREVLVRPTGMAWDEARQRLFVADTHGHNIKMFDRHGQLLEVFGSRGESPGEFNFPTYLAAADGVLYVSDTMNARIQKLDYLGESLTVVGGRGLLVGNLVRPKGVSLDSEGNLYVIESYYDHLLIYNGDGKVLLPIGGEGQGIGQFYLPSGVWVHRDQIYVADTFNKRVMMFSFLGGDGS